MWQRGISYYAGPIMVGCDVARLLDLESDQSTRFLLQQKFGMMQCQYQPLNHL